MPSPITSRRVVLPQSGEVPTFASARVVVSISEEGDWHFTIDGVEYVGEIDGAANWNWPVVPGWSITAGGTNMDREATYTCDTLGSGHSASAGEDTESVDFTDGTP